MGPEQSRVDLNWWLDFIKGTTLKCPMNIEMPFALNWFWFGSADTICFSVSCCFITRWNSFFFGSKRQPGRAEWSQDERWCNWRSISNIKKVKKTKELIMSRRLCFCIPEYKLLLALVAKTKCWKWLAAQTVNGSNQLTDVNYKCFLPRPTQNKKKPIRIVLLISWPILNQVTFDSTISIQVSLRWVKWTNNITRDPTKY